MYNRISCSGGEMDITMVYGTIIPGSNPGWSAMYLFKKKNERGCINFVQVDIILLEPPQRESPSAVVLFSGCM